MTKRKKAFVDKGREVSIAYYDLLEKSERLNDKRMKKELRSLIQQDPDFLDSYNLLYEILQDEGGFSEAEDVIGEAYQRAIKIIADTKGNWPHEMLWGYLANRHIIRAILNRALSFWMQGKTEDALELLRGLLKSNPGDNVGARDFILAIRMNMSFEEFEERFDKGGYCDSDLTDFFYENYQKFPDEFGWWDKAIEEME